MCSKFFIVLFFSSAVSFAANYPASELKIGGSVISSSNPLGVRLTDGTSYINSLPVTQNGTWNISVSNFPPIQPVSQSGVWNTSVSNFPAVQPVSVTSLPLPSGAATDRTTASSPFANRLTDGTSFYDARQIRSLISTDVVSSIQSGTWNVGITGTPTVVANIGTSGSLALDSSVNSLLKPASTLSAVTTVGTVGAVTAITNALPAGTNSIGTVQAPTITKGTQGTTGFMTQDLKDSGRVLKFYSAVFTAAATEALVTLTPISDGTAAATATSFTVTSGKRLRIQQICVSTRNAGAAGQGVVIQLRMTSTGSVTTSSPLVGTIATGSNLAIANSANSDCMIIPDGLELSGTQQFGVSQIGTATANNTVVIQGYEY